MVTGLQESFPTDVNEISSSGDIRSHHMVNNKKFIMKNVVQKSSAIINSIRDATFTIDSSNTYSSLRLNAQHF